MQTAKWLGFCLSNTLTRSVLHFFPSSGTVTAPYPANCKLTLFGDKLGRKTILLEEARLSNPDGVRLDDAFPALRGEVSGLCGLEVEISTMQPRTDLSASSCIIELESSANSVRYWPMRINEEAQNENAVADAPPVSAAAVRDAFHLTSFILVNGGQAPVKNPLFAASPRGEIETSFLGNLEQGLTPGSVSEINPGEEFFASVESQECSWGVFRARSVYRRSMQESHCACFIVYRDVLTKRPLSVVSL